MGYACEQNYCIASGGGNPAQAGSTGQKSGCSIGTLGIPTEPIPWRSLTGVVAMGALVLQRRRRAAARR
jgi:hypothetical protein